MFTDDRSPFLSNIPLGGRSLGAFARPEEFWDAWAFAAVEAELALAAWKRAAREVKAAAFATYRSALDREELAAARLAARIAPKVGERLHARCAFGPLERRRRRVLETGEPFFERHGPKAVFIGRWILGLRTWASWLAGASKMLWRSFAVWNAAGGISWATTIGLIAYFVGNTATSAITVFGLFGLLVVVFAAAGRLLLRRLHPRGA